MAKFLCKVKGRNQVTFEGNDYKNDGWAFIVEGRSANDITRMDLEKAYGKRTTSWCGDVNLSRNSSWEVTPV